MIVLDTHALLWWASGDAQLSPAAEKAIDAALASAGDVLVSAISAWEIAMLIDRNRVALAMDLDEWLAAVQSIDGITLMPITPQLAVQSVRLPGSFHKDPADRMIVALAREQNAVLISADDKIRQYPHVRSLW